MIKHMRWIAIYLPMTTWASNERIDIDHFSRGDLNEWQSKVFVGETRYSLESEDERIVLRADSYLATSGLYREVISIDLNETPLHDWIWKVNVVLTGNDERSKAGDDYTARVYVIFSGGVMFWCARSTIYGRTDSQLIASGSVRIPVCGHDPHTSGASNVGRWMKERRDVRSITEDYLGMNRVVLIP